MNKTALKDKCSFLEERVKSLNEIGLALSREDDTDVILELIMEEARKITHADGRTLYMKSDDGKTMNFAILRTDSTKTVMGGTSNTEITFPPIQLYDNKGKANMNHINTYVAHTGETLNIKDAYEEKGFDFQHECAATLCFGDGTSTASRFWFWFLAVSRLIGYGFGHGSVHACSGLGLFRDAFCGA